METGRSLTEVTFKDKLGSSDYTEQWLVRDKKGRQQCYH